MATPGRVPGQPRAAYVRHWPEDTRLYQIVAANYPTFRELLEQQGRPLPAYVAREFDEFLKCGRLEYGFLRVRCDRCHGEKLVAFSCKRRGFCRGRPAPVAVPGEWQRALRCWSTRCSHNVPFVSGC